MILPCLLARKILLETVIISFFFFLLILEAVPVSPLPWPKPSSVVLQATVPTACMISNRWCAAIFILMTAPRF